MFRQLSLQIYKESSKVRRAGKKKLKEKKTEFLQFNLFCFVFSFSFELIIYKKLKKRKKKRIEGEIRSIASVYVELASADRKGGVLFFHLFPIRKRAVV